MLNPRIKHYTYGDFRDLFRSQLTPWITFFFFFSRALLIPSAIMRNAIILSVILYNLRIVFYDRHTGLDCIRL